MDRCRVTALWSCPHGLFLVVTVAAAIIVVVNRSRCCGRVGWQGIDLKGVWVPTFGVCLVQMKEHRPLGERGG